MTKKTIKTVALHAIVYFLCVCVAVLIDLFLLKTKNMYHTPALSALFAGAVYVSLLRKAPTFGAITTLGLVMSVFFFSSGHYVWAFLPNLMCGLGADAIAKSGRYRDEKRNLLSYVVFCYGNLAPIVTMWINPKGYVAQLLAEGKTQAYVDAVMIPFEGEQVAILFFSVLGLAVAGYYLGIAWSNRRKTAKSL